MALRAACGQERASERRPEDVREARPGYGTGLVIWQCLLLSHLSSPLAAPSQLSPSPREHTASAHAASLVDLVLWFVFYFILCLFPLWYCISFMFAR